MMLHTSFITVASPAKVIVSHAGRAYPLDRLTCAYAENKRTVHGYHPIIRESDIIIYERVHRLYNNM
jgi:hypothetical protein